jgi:trigger factor
MTGFESSDGQVHVEVTEEGAVLRVLAVAVAAARVDKAFDRSYAELRKEVRVKGFRPGKTPRSVLERMYGASLPEQIERMLVSETLPDALELAGIQPLVEPGIDGGAIEAGSEFRYEARIEIKPEIELPETKGLPAKRPVTTVGDEEVLKQLEQLRERTAPLVEQPEGTTAADGHFVTIDFVGRVDGEPFEGGSAKGHEVALGSGSFVPGFEEQLIGATAGDDREVEIDFPDDYGNEELAGKHAVFEVHVDAIKARVIPELDDEFAKDLGEFESLSELRDRIRSDLESERKRAADSMLRRTVMDSLIERSDFEVPPGIVERQLQHQIESFRREYEAKVPAEVLQSQLVRMAEEGREAAARRVREAFLLEAVSKQHEIEASDEDVDARLEEMAEERGMPAEQLRKIASEQGWREAIRSELVDQKALDFLAEDAEIEEIEDLDESEAV